MILHNFIVFEGVDGAGTSTQINMLKEKFGTTLFATSEPTSLPTGMFLRKMLSGAFPVDERTAAYLFAADRCEHVYGKGGIIEHIRNGKLVVCDRYLFSTLAYQSVSCGEEIPRLVNSPFPLPELLFYFRIDPSLSFKRVVERSAQAEIYEKADFQRRVAAQYDAVMQAYKKTEALKIITLDASLPIQETAEIIWSYLQNLPIVSV
ncbi:MAG: dTMP kinase [Treponema sp.]|nr:dTMP kinase [Treponema sp.]